LVLLAGCRVADIPERGRLAAKAAGPRPSENLVANCVSDYSPAVDYFPHKARVEFATQFEIGYHGHYKRLIFKPNVGSEEREEYLLVQCGTPIPPHGPRARVVQVPAQRMILSNLAFVSSVVRMNLADSVGGVSSMNGVSHPAILERYKNRRVQEVGTGPHSSVELAIAADTDLLFTFYSAWPNYNTHPKLWEVGIQAIPTADHFEADPLGRTEWIKFIALFFNREREANEIFDPAAKRYLAMKRIAASVERRPEVLVGWPSGRDVWNLNGGKNFFAQLIWDAGGQYFWRDDLKLSLVPIDFERVFDDQRDSPVWISRSYTAKTRAALAKLKPALAHFHAFERDGIWSPDKNTQVHRRPPWQDQSLDKPDQVLADLIAILHPELIPKHEPFFVRKVD